MVTLGYEKCIRLQPGSPVHSKQLWRGRDHQTVHRAVEDGAQHDLHGFMHITWTVASSLRKGEEHRLDEEHMGKSSLTVSQMTCSFMNGRVWKEPKTFPSASTSTFMRSKNAPKKKTQPKDVSFY